MSRAIVLVSCLLAAAGVAAYTYSTGQHASQTPIYTAMVPQRPPEPASPPAAVQAAPQRAAVIPADRASITRELQRELKRVGCYSGDINGIWTTSSRMAMKSFIDAVNAALPIDNPDQVLLSLVQQRQDAVCFTEAKAPPQAEKEKSTTTLGAAVPAAAAAVGALAAAKQPDAAKLPPRAGGDDRPRAAAAPPPPPPAEQPSKATAPPDRSPRTASGGPVPAEGVYERKTRRSKQGTARPPKFVRNLMRALGFR